MSVEFLNCTGAILAAKVTGKLTHPELVAWQKTVVDLIQEQGTVRLQVIVEDFQGWEKHGDWSDISFQLNYDQHIERIALVCEKQWEDLILIFGGKGLREAPIEHFPPADLAKAQAWLAGDQTSRNE